MSVGENKPKDNCLLPVLTIFEFYKQYVHPSRLNQLSTRRTHTMYQYGIGSTKNSKLSYNNIDLRHVITIIFYILNSISYVMKLGHS